MHPLLLMLSCASQQPSAPAPTQVATEPALAAAPVSAPVAAARHATRTGWTPPSRREREAAIGPVPPELALALSPQGFEALEPPRPGEWLAEHEEPGQSFSDWLAEPVRLPGPGRRTIELQPIGDPRVDLHAVARVAEAWFGLPVEIGTSVPPQSTPATLRLHPVQGHPQLLAPDLLAWLEQGLRTETFALVGVAETDLYPAPEWNFVFGQATYDRGVGVWSTARFDPRFPEDRSPEELDNPLILERTVKVMTHELGHMLGMKHCTFFRCVMNGSNSMHETDAQPLWLCPVCLHKLLVATGADPEQRYQDLDGVYRSIGLEGPASWVSERLDTLRSGLVTQPPTPAG